MVQFKLTYLSYKCTLCGDCVNNCPANALDLFTGVIAYVEKRCIQCKSCQDVCANEAIRWEDVN